MDERGKGLAAREKMQEEVREREWYEGIAPTTEKVLLEAECAEGSVASQKWRKKNTECGREDQ